MRLPAKAFPWGPSPHLLYAEDLAPDRLAARIGVMLPAIAAPVPSLRQLLVALQTRVRRADPRRRRRPGGPDGSRRIPTTH